MKSFRTIFFYTLKRNAAKKSFIITTAVICILTVLLMALPGILGKNNEDGTYVSPEETISSKTLYICDMTTDKKAVVESFAKRLVGFKASFVQPEKLDEIKQTVMAYGDSSLMIVKQDENVLTFEYDVKTAASGADPDYLSDLLSYSNRAVLLKQAGFSTDLAEKMNTAVTYTVSELSGNSAVKTVMGIVILMLMFFAVYFYGYGVSMSVASEKTSRVMEILITSAKPSTIVLGKSSAMGVLGLFQFALILFSGAVSYFLFFPKGFALGGVTIDFSMFTPYVLCMLLVYFILGYSLFAMMQAVTGASVSKAEDLTSAMMPVSLISIISFYFGYASFASPDSVYSTVVSIIPFSAPFSMPLRLISGFVPYWQVGLSVLLMAVTTVFISFISIKIYSGAVLHYGSKLSLVKLFKAR